MNPLFLYSLSAYLWQREKNYITLSESLKFTKNCKKFEDYYNSHITKYNFMDKDIIEATYKVLHQEFENSSKKIIISKDISEGLFLDGKLLLDEYREFIITMLVTRKSLAELNDLFHAAEEDIEKYIIILNEKLYKNNENYRFYESKRNFPVKINKEELFKLREIIFDSIQYRYNYEMVANQEEAIIDIINFNFYELNYRNEENFTCPNCGSTFIKDFHVYCCICGKELKWNTHKNSVKESNSISDYGIDEDWEIKLREFDMDGTEIILEEEDY